MIAKIQVKMHQSLICHLYHLWLQQQSHSRTLPSLKKPALSTIVRISTTSCCTTATGPDLSKFLCLVSASVEILSTYPHIPGYSLLPPPLQPFSSSPRIPHCTRTRPVESILSYLEVYSFGWIESELRTWLDGR